MNERGSGTKPDNSGTSVYFTPNESLQPETTSTKNEEFLEKLANVVEGETSGETNSTSTSSPEVTDSLEEVVKILVNNSLISSLPDKSATAVDGVTVSNADEVSSDDSMDVIFPVSVDVTPSTSVVPFVDTAFPVTGDAAFSNWDTTSSNSAGDDSTTVDGASSASMDVAYSTSPADTVSIASSTSVVDVAFLVSADVTPPTSADSSVDTALSAAGDAASSAAAVGSGSSKSSTAASLHSSLNESFSSASSNKDISNSEEHNEIIEISSDSDIEVLDDSYGNLKGEKRSRTPDNQGQKCKSPKVQKCFQIDSDEEDGIPYQKFMRIKTEQGFCPPLKDSFNGRSSENEKHIDQDEEELNEEELNEEESSENEKHIDQDDEELNEEESSENNKHIDQDEEELNEEESSEILDSGSEIEDFSDTEELPCENIEERESLVEEVPVSVNNKAKEDSQDEEMPQDYSNRGWGLQTSNSSLVLNDTLDEVNMVCKEGLDYKVPECTSNINRNEAQSKPVIKISKAETNRKPQKSSKFDYIQSPIADYIRKKSPKLADFKMPVKLPKATPKRPTPAVHTNQLKAIVSPVGVYIKNSSEARLKQNVPVKSVANLFKSQTPTETTKPSRGGVDCVLPQAVYQPPKKTVTLKKKEITLPSSIKKLVKEPTIEKHERRQRMENSFGKWLLEEDLTINAADTVNTDVSYVSKKQAFIE